MAAAFSSRFLRRRDLFASTAAVFVASASGGPAAQGRSIRDQLPWTPEAGAPPAQVQPGPWVFFTPEEGTTVESIVDRIVPPDELGPGGKDAGCAVFIDRQLAGPYGRMAGLFMQPPFAQGTKEQGLQSPDSFADIYRAGLAALADHVHQVYVGKLFSQLPPGEQDKVLSGLENGDVALKGADGKRFFGQVLTNTIEGYFADPVYGGNKDMAGWKLVGFPGVRYDYRDYIERYGETYPLPPVGITGRPDWTVKG
jgi:gluconate 2-dehydrogenase gamma chain